MKNRGRKEKEGRHEGKEKEERCARKRKREEGRKEGRKEKGEVLNSCEPLTKSPW